MSGLFQIAALGLTVLASACVEDVVVASASTNDAGPAFACQWSYPHSSYTLALGLDTTISPAPGCAQASYTEVTGLPDGLTLDTTSGEIRGAPNIAVEPAASYQIRGTSSSGSHVVSLSLTILPGTLVSSEAELNSAISDSNFQPGRDVIVVAPGTITLTGALRTIADELTIIGASPSTTIIDGAESFRHFRIELQSQGEVRIVNFTLQNGYYDGSGGSIGVGGLQAPTLIVDNCRFLGNHSTDYGGAIRLQTHPGASLQVYRSHFEDNLSDDGGGAITTGGGTIGQFVVENCSFINNTALENLNDAGGGAIRLQDTVSGARVKRSLFSGNTSTLRGGALDFASTVEVTNCSFFANSAPLGGAIHSAGNVFTSTNATFADNTSADGSAIAVGAGSLRLQSNLFARNGTNACSGTGISSLGDNLSDASDADCNLSQSTDAEHLDLLLASTPADHGGGTQTLALLPGSPAIDGSESCPPNNLDQRGQPRPADGDGDGTDTCDVGAFELQ
jgi:predicted outer membrane repeat protein